MVQLQLDSRLVHINDQAAQFGAEIMSRILLSCDIKVLPKNRVNILYHKIEGLAHLFITRLICA